MRALLNWDDNAHSIVRWDFQGFIGMIDYVEPITETVHLAQKSGSSTDLIINIGWKMPFSSRPFKYVYLAFSVAPRVLQTTVIVSRNPITRWIITSRLMDPHPDLMGRIYLASSIDEAHAMITDIREAALRRTEEHSPIQML